MTLVFRGKCVQWTFNCFSDRWFWSKDLPTRIQRVVGYLPCSVSGRGARRSHTPILCAFSDNVPENCAYVIRRPHRDQWQTAVNERKPAYFSGLRLSRNALAGLVRKSFRATAGAVASFCRSCSCTVAQRLWVSCSQQPRWSDRSLAALQRAGVHFQHSHDCLAHVLWVVLEDWVRDTSVLDWMRLACKGLRFQGAILGFLLARKWR